MVPLTSTSLRPTTQVPNFTGPYLLASGMYLKCPLLAIRNARLRKREGGLMSVVRVDLKMNSKSNKTPRRRMSSGY
jgi:hypothetical protein